MLIYHIQEIQLELFMLLYFFEVDVFVFVVDVCCLLLM